MVHLHDKLYGIAIEVKQNILHNNMFYKANTVYTIPIYNK